MKKLFLMMALLVATLTAHAADYAYLTFETTDGAKISVPAESLNITISGTTLTAGGQSFTLSNLNKMYFSNSNETTEIGDELRLQNEEIADIYDLNGRKVSKDQLPKGAYLVKNENGTYKIVVK
ncbi:MAG: hypothetical protein IKX17_01370 [Prevotella sp.]|nr:hypothetical protein [Prevotella sp.]